MNLPPFPHSRQKSATLSGQPLQLDLDLGETLGIPASLQVAAAVEDLAEATTAVEARGAIFTRSEVVDFMLDLVGYTPDQPLHTQRILEPCFGEGSFLLPIVTRLLKAWEQAQPAGSIVETLGHAIGAVELHRATFAKTYEAVVALLIQFGLSVSTGTALADAWLSQEDFLLTTMADPFDVVVGNPPYVRPELIPEPLLTAYRNRFSTMRGRADLYIPFIEKCLSLLPSGGRLGFICPDRWMKNRYGESLRRLIAEQFHLKIFVDMVGTSAFNSEVTAYPAITVIARETPGRTRAAHCSTLDPEALSTLAKTLLSPVAPNQTGLIAQGSVRELAQVAQGHQPWLLGSSGKTAILRRIEQAFPRLATVGCKVGIGVATGADKAFIGDYETLDVEPDRKLPLVTTQDIVSGEVQWHGLGVINPFQDRGGLVELTDYPRLRRYLEAHRETISRRYCAQKNPAHWYRTIDRISPSLATKPKLLIPDIKGEAHIVFEDGNLYPHHNLYFITAEDWDLRALQAVLLSAVTRLFVTMYSTPMRGGFLRYQAQHLRRICLPTWSTVSQPLRMALAEAAMSRDRDACNQATFELYGLTAQDQEMLRDPGER